VSRLIQPIWVGSNESQNCEPGPGLIGCRYRALYKAEIVFTNITFRSSDKEPLAMTSLLIVFPAPEMAAPGKAYGILR
jgi:hypothetical protein